MVAFAGACELGWRQRNENPFHPDLTQRFGPGLAGSRLRPIDHKGGHPVEEFPKDLLGLAG
jgi:hypothetical protein